MVTKQAWWVVGPLVLDQRQGWPGSDPQKQLDRDDREVDCDDYEQADQIPLAERQTTLRGTDASFIKAHSNREPLIKTLSRLKVKSVRVQEQVAAASTAFGRGATLDTDEPGISRNRIWGAPFPAAKDAGSGIRGRGRLRFPAACSIGDCFGLTSGRAPLAATAGRSGETPAGDRVEEVAAITPRGAQPHLLDARSETRPKPGTGAHPRLRHLKGMVAPDSTIRSVISGSAAA